MIHYGNKSEINTSLYTYCTCTSASVYFRTSVRNTFVLSYFRTKVLPEVLRTSGNRYLVRKYESTFVRRYFRTFVVVLSYERIFEKVLPYCTRVVYVYVYLATYAGTCTALHVYVYESCTCTCTEGSTRNIIQ
jgi:hypothetical protein